MFRRSLIVWKLSAVFIAIILVVFVILAYVNNRVDGHYALASARDQCRFNSATIWQSIKKPLMARDNESIKEIIGSLVKDNPAYREMRLVSHEGRIAGSAYDAGEERLPRESRSCQVCHRYDDPFDGAAVSHHDEIVELPDGTRAVSVITPILNEATCSTAACHAHADAPPVLGFLQADYSLHQVDVLTSTRNSQTVVAALIAILLGTLGTWFMVGRLLDRPLRSLITGMKRIAGGDLDFRMDVRRKDEFATAAESFNDMTSKFELLLCKLRETKDYLEGILESSADIIVTVNRAGFIQTFNTGAEKVLGYAREEVIDQPVAKLFADPLERDVVIARLKGSDHVANYETRFLAKSGEIRDIIFSLSRLRGPYEFHLGTFAIGKDVTNEKRLQRKLIQSERFTAIGQSFVGLQHALKNMLSLLKGGSYMVKTGIKKADQEMLADGWEIVEEGISSITELSKDMLRYVKRWEPEFEWVSVGKIIEKIDSAIAQAASAKGVGFSTSVPPELPDVYCDSNLIYSAIMDIVSNAMDACLSKEYPEGASPRIDLAATYDEGSGKLAIEIRDNGPGMPEEVKDNIFTPFFSTKKNKGTGLGLALTARVVSLHNGTIEVTSEPDRGAAFHMLLPVGGPDKCKENRDGEKGDGHR